MVIVRKPGKPNYTKLGAYWPIVLINTIAKILLACVTEDLTDIAEICQLLPANHFGCHPGRTTSDSLHYIMKFTKDTWRKGEVTSSLFLNIKGVLLSIILNLLIHDMRTKGILPQYTYWIYRKVSGRQTSITFNGHSQTQEHYWEALTKDAPYQALLSNSTTLT